MTTYNSYTSGLWSATGTWNASTIPASGDTVNVLHFITYDVPDTAIITGTLSPNVTGVYSGTGTYFSQIYYTHPTSGYYLYHSPTGSNWMISSGLGAQSNYWLGPDISSNQRGITGLYSNYGTCSGSPKVDYSHLEIGPITIATTGTLSFSTSGNTCLLMNHNNLTVNGELRIGTSGSVLLKNYFADILFNTTADNAKGIIIAAGGKFNLYGDPTFYGGT
jgi:hypothetical protein